MDDFNMECSSLVDELHRYCLLTKMLQKSLQDTRKTFKDINAAKCFVESQAVLAEISATEESVIQTVANSPPCLVILGKSIQARVDVANWIFGEDYLPVPADRPWHTILFRYGARNRVTGIDDCSSASPRKPHFWKLCVPVGNVECNAQDECSVVDVRANHPLLHAGARLAVSSWTPDAMKCYQLCVRDTMPIVVFAVQGSSLSDEEIRLLQYIRKSDHSLAVYFVKMSTSVERRVASSSELNVEALCAVSSSPQIYKQLIALEFFTDANNPLSQPPSDIENSLTDTITASEQSQGLHRLQHQQQQQLVGVTQCEGQQLDGAVVGADCCVLLDTMSTSLPVRDTSAIKTSIYSRTSVEHVTHNLPHINGDSIPVSACHVDTTVTAVTADTAVNAVSSDADRPDSWCTQPPVERTLSDIDSESSCVALTDSEFVEGLCDNFCNNLATFCRSLLQTKLLSTVAVLYTVHRRCLDTMISLAFDMAWDVVCTPTRLKFAQRKEEELYNSLMRVALKKQDEIKQIIVDTIASEQDSVLQCASMLQFTGTETLGDSGEMKSYTVQQVKDCTTQIQDLVIARLNAAISCKLLKLVNVLHDSYTGVLTRCLESLEQKDVDSSKSTETSDALKEILNAAYNVEITVCSGASFVKTLIEKMKQLMHGVLLRTPSSLDDVWKRRVALNVLSSLTEARCQRLAKSICAQIKDRVRRSHLLFETSLQRLEVHHNGRLQQTEKQRLHVRKEYAPRIARLALESRSLRDLILYGKPVLGPEVGRGQYGVVYSCESWAGFGPCAVKSVAPPDDRHWNDLALEFHYTTNIPEHERIVSLRGSIIDYTYGVSSGSTRNPAVLLIMDRFKCDLYAAIERHLNWISRLQVAVDVVEGIRYLHAQGLVHRDIKLKNVLLDTDNRGHLTDLGFCKPEAMMSGSIVGTPLHMAPELVTGKYDHSVDVYAFGVLFWYVCAGTVRLPTHFEVCTNKDMLFTLVRKGLRPERPVDCDRDCWDLMNRCWDGEPSRRPHVGELEICLRSIYERFVSQSTPFTAAVTQVSTTDNNLTEIDVIESLTTDSDADFDDLTLQ